MYVCVGGVSMQPAELSQGHNYMWLVNDIKSSSFTCIIQGLSCASAAYLAVTGMAQHRSIPLFHTSALAIMVSHQRRSH